jgi:uncharacterized protein involved in tolerance to divalent cations
MSTLVPSENARIVFITAPPNEATSLARILVESDLVACVNVVQGISSL